MQTEEGATKGREHTNSHMMQPYSGTILAFPQLFDMKTLKTAVIPVY